MFKVREVHQCLEANKDSEYKLRLVLKGEHGNTKHLSISREQANKILKMFIISEALEIKGKKTLLDKTDKKIVDELTELMKYV